MKKTILMLMLMVFTFGLMAQTVFTFAIGSTAKGDSVQNTGTIYKPITLTKNFTAGAIQVVNTKVSGTVAGTSILQYSVDGTNWVTKAAVGDTLTNTDVTTNTKIWDLNPVLYKYYRVVSTGSGTMAMLTRAYAYLKEEK